MLLRRFCKMLIGKLLNWQKVFTTKRKAVFLWQDEHFPVHRNLARSQAKSRYMRKLFVLYEHTKTCHVFVVLGPV